MASHLVFESLGAIFSSLSSERKRNISEVTTILVRLGLPQDTIDAILSVIILEVSENQFIEEGGAAPPPRDSTMDILRPIFESKRKKTSPGDSN